MWQSIPTTRSPGNAAASLVRRLGAFVCNPELVALQPGRDVGWVLSPRWGPECRRACRAPDCATSFKTSSSASLDIEAADARLSAWRISSAGLPHAGKYYLGRVCPSGKHNAGFAAGDDVKPTAAAGKHPKHPQRRVGLHGVADFARFAGEAALVGGEGRKHRKP